MQDQLTLDDLCRASAVAPGWVQRAVDEGLLPVTGRTAEEWRFELVVLRRVRVMQRIEQDFDAVPELAALVADLHEEIDQLRARLLHAGID